MRRARVYKSSPIGMKRREPWDSGHKIDADWLGKKQTISQTANTTLSSLVPVDGNGRIHGKLLFYP
jgi:hypothetical protein